MSRLWSAALLLLCLLTPMHSFAASAVFANDPIDPATSLPYEILPGLPLVTPGPDGRLGTADDVVDATKIGDIDLVVRAGSPPASAIIPPPAALAGRNTLPIGVAGASGAGGVEIPFTVFLSDGVVGASQPFGTLLAAADMDGIPVVVAAFADLDQDDFIGPTDADGGGDNALEVRELEAVGRAVAIFSGGVARGSIAVRAGLPASQGGLTVALTAQALTGPSDPAFFAGNVPTGPAISTALPFLPERDLARLIRDRAAAVGPTTTLQQVIQFASIPAPDAPTFALRLDGSEATIDAALVQSQAAVGVAFREDVAEPGVQLALHDLVFGTRSPANVLRVRVLAVDRWGNPSDPTPGTRITLLATPPLKILRPARARAGKDIVVPANDSVRVRIKVPRGLADGTAGTLTAERNGLVVAALPCTVDARADRFAADIAVPSAAAATIQAAIDAVSDLNHDGVLSIDLAPGLYRETLAINRTMVLRGAGAGATLVQGAGALPTISVAAAGVRLRGLTAAGGSAGFALDGADVSLLESRAWRNVGTGISLSGPNPVVWRAIASDNGGDGVVFSGLDNALCTDTLLSDNRGGGALLSGVQAGLFSKNQIVDNGASGVSLVSADDLRVADNQSVNNLGSGFDLFTAQRNQMVGNLAALNDENGLGIESTSGNLISANVFATNHKYGLFVRRSTGDDFAAATGLQPPPGDNASSDNGRGDVLTRPK